MAEIITRKCVYCGQDYTFNLSECANFQLDYCSIDCMDKDYDNWYLEEAENYYNNVDEDETYYDDDPWTDIPY